MSFRFFPFYAMLMKTNLTEGEIAMSENTKTCRKLPFYYHYDTPIGLVRIEETGDALTGLYLYQKHSFPLEEHMQYYRETVLIAEAHRQLLEYFKGQRKTCGLQGKSRKNKRRNGSSGIFFSKIRN